MAGVARHGLTYAVGIMLNKGIAFLMLPVYTRFLSPADYGVLALVEMTLDVISILAGAQLALGMFRYYHKTEDAHERHAVVSTTLVALAVSYAFIGACAFAAAGPLSTLVFGDARHAPLLRIASMSLAFQSLLIVPLSFARLTDRSTLFVATNAVKLVLSLSLNILFLVYYEMGVRGIFLSTLIANVITGTGLLVWTLRTVGLRYSPAATRDLLRYGVPMIGTQLATFVATFGDRYFLQATGDEAVVGLYNLSYQFGFLLFMLGYAPFEMIWVPKRFEIAKRADRDVVLAQGFRYANLLLLPAAAALTLFVRDVLQLMSTPPFHPAADIVPVILIAYVLLAWVGMQDIGILVRERTSLLTLVNWVAALVALAGYALLIPRWLGFGAAVATVLSFAVRYVLTYAISQHLWPVRYDWGPVVRLTALTVVAGIAGYLVPADSLTLSIAAHSAIFVAYLAAGWTLGGLTAEDKSRARMLLAGGLARLRSA